MMTAESRIFGTSHSRHPNAPASDSKIQIWRSKTRKEVGTPVQDVNFIFISLLERGLYIGQLFLLFLDNVSHILPLIEGLMSPRVCRNGHAALPSK